MGLAHCNQCIRLSVRKHVRIGTKMHTPFPALGVFLVVFSRFLAHRHPPDSVPAVCTRLKKMHATACIKIGNLRSGLRPLRDGRLAVNPSFISCSPLLALHSVLAASLLSARCFPSNS